MAMHNEVRLHKNLGILKNNWRIWPRTKLEAVLSEVFLSGRLTRARILVEVTIWHRLWVGRDDHLPSYLIQSFCCVSLTRSATWSDWKLLKILKNYSQLNTVHVYLTFQLKHAKMVNIIILNAYFFQHVLNFGWRERVETTSARPVNHISDLKLSEHALKLSSIIEKNSVYIFKKIFQKTNTCMPGGLRDGDSSMLTWIILDQSITF